MQEKCENLELYNLIQERLNKTLRQGNKVYITQYNFDVPYFDILSIKELSINGVRFVALTNIVTNVMYRMDGKASSVLAACIDWSKRHRIPFCVYDVVNPHFERALENRGLVFKQVPKTKEIYYQIKEEFWF